MIRPALAAFALAAFAAAQDPLANGRSEPGPAPGQMPPLELEFPLFDAPGDGRVWALGADYKASFGSDGAAFIPFLGSDSTESASLHFALRQAVVAGVELPLAAKPPIRRDRAVELDHGSLQEIWQVRADGIEQTFRFAALPVRGELAIAIDVSTGLGATPDGAGILFAGERAAVRYGRAFAIDAKGERLTLETTWHDGRITLRVPADFVARASLPLLIDPLVSNAASFTDVGYVWSGDAAFDASLGEYVVTYTREYSTTDHDVFVRRFDTELQPRGGPLTIDFTTTLWADSHIAGLEARDRFLVVASEGEDVAIVGRTISIGATVGVSNSFTIARFGMPSVRDGRRGDPDVGGSSLDASSARWIVVWRWSDPNPYVEDGEIEGRTVDADGISLGPLHVLSDPAAISTDPCISKHGGEQPGQERWAMVFRRFVPNGNTYTISMRRAVFDAGLNTIASDGPLGGPAPDSLVSVSPLTDFVGGTRRFLAVFSGQGTAGGGGDIYGVLFGENGQLLESAQNLTEIESGDPTFRARSQWGPVVDTDGCRFVIVYRDQYTHTDSDVRIFTIAHEPAVLPYHWSLHDRSTLGSSFDPERNPILLAPRIAARPHRYLVGMTLENAAATQWTTVLRLYDGMRSTGGFSSRATGCGGLNLAASGEPALGAPFRIETTNALGLAGLFVGVASSTAIAACPGCILGTSIFATLPTPSTLIVPCDPALVGGAIAMQGFDTAQAACLGLVRLSNTIDVVIR